MKTIAEEIIRQEIKCGYRGVSRSDSAFYFAPYRPGMTPEERMEVAQKITETGQRILTELQKRINESVGIPVLWGDTDSITERKL